jgi:glycosyltransferase involved in cell wall biosynthesis
MKIGLFIGDNKPTDGGGYTFVENFLAGLSRLRQKAEHELVLCYHRGSESLARQFPEFPAIDLDAGDERIYAQEGIQFLVRPNPWDEQMSMDIPHATVVWDLEHRTYPWFPEVSSLGRWQARETKFSLLVRRATLLFTGTEEGRRQIEQFYQVSQKRIKVLSFPIPMFARDAAATPIDPEVLRRLGVPADYLFYPAQFWPHKNHAVLLEAIKLVREKIGWDLGVVFTGVDKGNLEYIRGYARRLSLEQHVRFLGFVDQQDLPHLYKGAFCLAYPTFFGPDNLPPLEAFALGCPVLASEIPGAREQYGDAAILIPPTDEGSWAEAIIKMRDEACRERTIAAGRVRVSRRTWDDYAQDVLESVGTFIPTRRCWD